MIDLHLHLDGSLTPSDLFALASLTGVPLPTEDPAALRAMMTFDGRGSLNDYLQKFDLPLSFLQSGEAVAFAVRALASRLAALGYTYAEVRFAPMLHTQKGASPEEIVQGAIKGLEGSNSEVKLILCCMRARQRSSSREEQRDPP